MNVLVATRALQGQRKNDFCHAWDGEIVRFQIECPGEKIDAPCGCRRSMAGTDTSTATTTMKVLNMEITPEQFRAKIESSLRKDGWISDDLPGWQKLVEEEAEELLRIAAAFEVDTVVEKRGVEFRPRTKKQPLAA